MRQQLEKVEIKLKPVSSSVCYPKVVCVVVSGFLSHLANTGIKLSSKVKNVMKSVT